MKKRIYVADLTHTAQGISAATFPLGASYVVSYAKSQLGDDFDFTLFKFPEALDQALQKNPPAMLCFSNYSWNFELSYKVAGLAKKKIPGLITIFGGPNFPSVDEEKCDFLRERVDIDFYVELEGELGFVELVKRLQDYDLDASKLKEKHERVLNTMYLHGRTAIGGPVERIKDLEKIPSPYLSGTLDEFFKLPLVPMIETSRGCPFACTFCADGIATKNKVSRFGQERVRGELRLIAENIQGIDELVITDLNFGMYPQDIETSKELAAIKKEHNWPVLISASAGKNKPTRTIEAANILGGAWTLGASIQSTDPDVLKAIKRSNISSAAYKQLIDHGNSLSNSKTHSEIILGLPADTKEKHFESLRFGVDSAVNSMRMFQAMLLLGTEMAAKHTREKYDLKTKFRTIPGCVGIYTFFGEKHAVSEIEEIIVGSNTLPFDDYIECRVMNLILETFYNNAMFEEVFSMVRTIGGSVFDCLLNLKKNTQRYPKKVLEIIEEFTKQTSQDLFNTRQEAEDFVLTPEIIGRYIGGELGINELLVHKALLVGEFDSISELIFTAVEDSLTNEKLLSPAVQSYLSELKMFTVLRKRNAIMDTQSVTRFNFHYDFESIRELSYKVDPNTLKASAQEIPYVFYHSPEQKEHIAHQLNVYMGTPIGIGRLIQRSNLKLIYRSFERGKEVSL